MILTDALAERIHAMHRTTLRAYAEAYCRIRPDAAYAEVGTGFALFAGEGSPLTQCFGFAHRSPGDPAELERFFAPHTSDWEVSVTPFTDGDTVRALLGAGYRFGGFEGELAQIVGNVPDVPDYDVREIGDDAEAWLEATTRAWQEDESPTFRPSDLERATNGLVARRYVAFVDGVPAAACSMAEDGDAVLLMGGATRLPYRGRGLQAALFARRLRDAGRGRLAVVGAAPGTASFRNAQRAGFTPLYSTVALHRR